MEMKRIGKRINRGIVLGAVLFVGFIGFTIKSGSDFKKESAPEIKKTIAEYFNELGNISVLPESMRDGDIDDAERQQLSSARNDLISKYWASYDKPLADSYAYEPDIKDFMQTLDFSKAEQLPFGGYLEKAYPNFEEADIEVMKLESNVAYVSFSGTVVLDHYGSCTTAFSTHGDYWRGFNQEIPFEFSGGTYYNYETGDEYTPDEFKKYCKDNKIEVKNVMTKTTADINGDALMMKSKDGKWQFVRLFSYAYSNISSAISENE